MIETLVSYEQLQSATGCKTKVSLEKVLRANKVQFLYGNHGKPFTTVNALDSAMGLRTSQPNGEEIEFIR